MSLETIKGVGVVRREILDSLGMESVGDLLNRFPKDYLFADSEPESLQDGAFVALFGTFMDAPKLVYSKKGGRFATATLISGSKKLHAIWFSADFVLHSVKPNTPYLVMGRVKMEGSKITIAQPVCDGDITEKVLPIYRLSNKISQKIFRKIIRNALSKFPMESMIPDSLIEKSGLLALGECYHNLHIPMQVLSSAEAELPVATSSAVDLPNEDRVSGMVLREFVHEKLAQARSRIELERFFSLLLSFRISRTYQKERDHRYIRDAESLCAFVSRFPFSMTDSQNKAVDQIFEDLSGRYPMNRLLQGDVGSGKTAVAACTIFLALTNGLQSAIAAPTEVLARQHFDGFSALFAGLGEVVLLTSSVTGKARVSALAKIADGRAKVIIGTHSILQSTVKYHNLALVVIDEQHKFGVMERAKLVEKGENCDVLVMSATPIPRTLSLLFYNDLNVSTLCEKPANRGTVTSFMVRGGKRLNMLNYLGEQGRKGEKIYVVCPCVDEEDGVEAVKTLHAELARLFPDVGIGLLYGDLKEVQKQAVIAQFREGKVSILVSTTVIEVGVDVPSANFMAIMNAERFGLAQLHQLRGRIGRGCADGFCYFYTETENAGAIKRLEFLKGTNDGFAISEEDFKLRGPGDYFGSSQSGFDKTLVDMDVKRYEQAKMLVNETELSQAFMEKYLRICREKNLKFPSVVLN